jgi:hypothetical protein
MKFKNCVRVATICMSLAGLPVWLAAQGIRLTPGSYMIMDGPVNLVLNNAGFITDGGFKQGTGTIIYTGNATAVQPLLGSSNTTAFKHVTINRPSNDVLLNGDIVIDGTLTMISGHLQLNNHTLNLTGIITGESNQSHVTGITGGVIRTSAKLAAPLAVNPGNIGVAITSAANLGATVITRGHIQQTLPNGTQAIQRYFDITPANNADLNATLRFYYLEAELANANESILSFWSRTSGTTWQDIGKDNSDVTNNWVFKSGINTFTRFTLAPEASALFRVNVNTNTSSLNSLDKTAIAVQVYPNPLHEQFIVSLSTNQEKEYVMSLYNQYGQLLQSKSIWCRKGMNQTSWNMNNYANGVYYLVFENKELENIKIIKQ